MTPKQPALFDMPPKPRQKRRVLMFVADAGFHDVIGDAAKWFCIRCDYETDWTPAPTMARPPCPRCNA